MQTYIAYSVSSGSHTLPTDMGVVMSLDELLGSKKTKLNNYPLPR